MVGGRPLIYRTVAQALLIALSCAGFFQIVIGAFVPIKAVAAQILLERAFDRSLIQHRPRKPWPWADMAPVARLRVPRLGVDRIVLDSGSGQAMAFGPTMLPGGARLGAPGVTIVAAHRDTHFRFLAHIRAGDTIEAQGVDGVVHRYRVTRTQILRWDRFAVSPGATHQLALATCYPFGAVAHGPLRFVVWAVAS